MWNFESDQSEILCSNRFPARGIVRYTGEGKYLLTNFRL